MMAAMLANGTRTVVVERLDRVARDLMVQESIIADYKRKGRDIIERFEFNAQIDRLTLRTTMPLIRCLAIAQNS